MYPNFDQNHPRYNRKRMPHPVPQRGYYPQNTPPKVYYGNHDFYYAPRYNQPHLNPYQGYTSNQIMPPPNKVYSRFNPTSLQQHTQSHRNYARSKPPFDFRKCKEIEKTESLMVNLDSLSLPELAYFMNLYSGGDKFNLNNISLCCFKLLKQSALCNKIQATDISQIYVALEGVRKRKASGHLRKSRF